MPAKAAPKPRGRPPHEPTERTRKLVTLLSATKIVDQDEIAYYLNISTKTLRQHYGTEIDRGKGQLKIMMLGKVIEKALGGDGASQRYVLDRLCGLDPRLKGGGDDGDSNPQITIAGDAAKL